MNEILKELTLPSLTWKQRLIVWYFAISFCTLCVGDDTPIWIIILIVLNFGNAARLVRKVPLPEKE